jgi:hypothetical protein
MNTVTVKIDISRPAGRKLLRELSTKKVAKVEYPLPAEINGINVVTMDELFQEAESYMNAHYGTNLKI